MHTFESCFMLRYKHIPCYFSIEFNSLKSQPSPTQYNLLPSFTHSLLPFSPKQLLQHCKLLIKKIVINLYHKVRRIVGHNLTTPDSLVQEVTLD